MLYGGAAGGGKAQPLRAKIATPFGWKRMGDVVVGDIVCTPDGGYATVLQIHDHPVSDVYTITTQDGSTCEASKDHLWYSKVLGARKSSWRVRTTEEMLASSHTYVLPLGVVEKAPVELPIEPYILGCLLGDGSISTRSIAIISADIELIERMRSKDTTITKRSACLQYGVLGLAQKLRNLQLLGTRSHDKFIPDIYKHSSLEQRLELIRGLMDTDGYVSADGKVNYTSMSERLRDDVAELIRSVGGTAKIMKGHTLYIRHRNSAELFSLSRKKLRCHTKNINNRIVSITKTSEEVVRCITIDSPDQLYLTDNYIVTHNSYAMLADPLRYLGHPQFSGLLLRHTTEELRELIWKSQEMYPKIYPGIKWSERKMQWQAPSGARLWMSYLDRDEDVLRYQGLSFCVAENTPVALANNTFTPIENISVGDEVATLEGKNKVVFKSKKLQKKCVRVELYSADGSLLSSQIQPYNHPIAVLSSKPLQSLSDLSQIADKLQTSPVQWLSFEQIQSGCQEIRDSFAYPEDGKNCYTASGHDSLGDQRLPSLFFPVVLHSPVRQLSQDHVSTQFDTFCKSLQWWLDSNQCLQNLSLDQQQLDEFALLHKDHNKQQACRVCNDDVGDLLGKQRDVDSLDNCLTCSHQCDEQLPCDLVFSQDFSQQRDDVEQHSHNDSRFYDTGYIQQHIQYLSSSYAHPYTKEQRNLGVPVELGFVKFVALDDPLCNVYDITVDESNHYITFGGIVNRNCWIGFDELTQWHTPFAWNYMRSRLRTSANDLPICMRATTNPGGPGHAWVKKMFIDPAPAGKAFPATDIETGNVLVYPRGHSKEGLPLFKRKFIPAMLTDNPYLADGGDYETMLLSLPEHQRKQLLEGNWDVAEGAAFPEFNRAIHVIEPFDIPSNWVKFRSADYGYGSYSAVVWFAISPSDQLIIYRELYVSKVLAKDLAHMILRAEEGDGVIRYGVLDSSCWAKRGDTGPSLAEQMILEGCRWKPADRSAGSRVAGKQQLHRRLQVDPFTEQPRMVITSNCVHTIAQLPVIPLDKSNPEDIDTKSEDHLYDAIRYGIMSRPRSSDIFEYSPVKNYSVTPADSVFGY